MVLGVCGRACSHSIRRGEVRGKYGGPGHRRPVGALRGNSRHTAGAFQGLILHLIYT
jgi:hypothetical protein